MKLTKPLGITKAEFIEFYPHADHEIFYRDPKSDIEFEGRFLTNKLWRLNNLYTITNKMGVVIPFVMNISQHRVYAASLLHSRLLILKSRQQGISTFWLLDYFDDSLFIDHLDIGLMSQGKDESGTLLTRTKLAWEKLGAPIKYFLQIGLRKDNADELGLSNGSTIFIRTSFRSTTLQRLHISEYGKICNKYPERAKETKTGSLQAIAPGNTCVIESTAEGVNDFKTMWDKSWGRDIATLGPKEFLAIFLSWLDDPTCVSSVERVPTPEQEEYFAKIEFETGRIITQEQKNFWIDQYEELEESGGMVVKDGTLTNSSIYQEYPSTPEEAFKAIRDGTYYAHAYTKYVINRGRRIVNLYDPNLSVEVAVDLGMDDFFVLLFFQVWQEEYRIIHEYANNGHGIDHYAAYMLGEIDADNGNPCENYEIANVYLPWDAAVRDLSATQGSDGRRISRETRFHEEGIRQTVILPKMSVSVGIEQVRKMLPNIWIDQSCEYIDSCFLNYSKKWNHIIQKWDDTPMKSDFNHGADTLRAMACSRERGIETIHSKKNKKKQNKQVVDGMAM